MALATIWRGVVSHRTTKITASTRRDSTTASDAAMTGGLSSTTTLKFPLTSVRKADMNLLPRRSFGLGESYRAEMKCMPVGSSKWTMSRASAFPSKTSTRLILFCTPMRWWSDGRRQSQSTSSTLCPDWAADLANERAVVDFPSSGAADVTRMTRGGRSTPNIATRIDRIDSENTEVGLSRSSSLTFLPDRFGLIPRLGTPVSFSIWAPVRNPWSNRSANKAKLRPRKAEPKKAMNVYRGLFGNDGLIGTLAWAMILASGWWVSWVSVF